MSLELMMDKQKRKGQPDNIKRYWLIFSGLFLVLLLMLRYPLRVYGTPWLNPVLYILIVIVSLIIGVMLIRRYGWRQKITGLILACALLSGWIAYLSPTDSMFEPSFCSTQERGIGVYHSCVYIGNCPTIELGYIGIRSVPIVLKIHDYYDNPCGYPRPKSWR